MSESIRDDTACTFASQLYSSIGFGRSLQVSFNQAIAELLLEGIPGENIPQIYARDDVDLNDMILVRPDVEATSYIESDKIIFKNYQRILRGLMEH